MHNEDKDTQKNNSFYIFKNMNTNKAAPCTINL